jgi:hypothetical protein
LEAALLSWVLENFISAVLNPLIKYYYIKESKYKESLVWIDLRDLPWQNWVLQRQEVRTLLLRWIRIVPLWVAVGTLILIIIIVIIFF